MGCEVHIFTRGPKKRKIRRRIGKGYRILHTIKTDFNFHLKDEVIARRLNYSIFESKVLNEMAYENSKRKFDILHTHGWLASPAFILKHFNNLNYNSDCYIYYNK